VEAARLALPPDLPVCAELLAQALAAARTQRGGATLAGPITAGDLLDRWDTNVGTVLLVGEFHHVVVGIGAATTQRRHPTDTLSGRIECCYVEEEARGVGVGTALMDGLVAWCATQGTTDIDALALPGDRISKQRLEAAGFTARLLTLNRRLS